MAAGAVPLIVVLAVIAGREFDSVMVCGVANVVGSKVMVEPGEPFASMMAWRSDPAPLSPVLEHHERALGCGG